MANFKLQQQILLGCLISIPFSILTAGLVYSTAKTLETNNINIATQRQILEQADSITVHAQRIERSTRGYLINREKRHIAGFEKGKDSFIQEYQSLKASGLITDLELKNILDGLIQTGHQLIDVDQKMISLAQQGKLAEAVKLFSTDKSSVLVRNVYDINNAFHQRNQKILDQQQLALNQAITFLNAVAILGTIISASAAVAFGLLFASHLSKKINQSINNIASSANEIVATIEQQERTASNQSVAVTQTTTTMDELNASSDKSAQQAEAAATKAAQILVLVNGNEDSEDHRKDHSLRAKVSDISKQISDLNQHTQQIGRISKLVSELANQTNMLALNAAVEAVRAGEHGRGFAVVASEIRKLADQSKHSAQQINALVIDVQTATNSTVFAAEEGKKTVEGVVNAVNSIVINSQQISSTAKQQAIAIQQVVVAMNNIQIGARETAIGIAQTEVSIQKLNQAAQNLQTIV